MVTKAHVSLVEFQRLIEENERLHAELESIKSEDASLKALRQVILGFKKTNLALVRRCKEAKMRKDENEQGLKKLLSELEEKGMTIEELESAFTRK